MAPGVVDVTPMLPERPYAPFRRYQSTYNPTVRLYYQIHTKRVSIALLKMTRVSASNSLLSPVHATNDPQHLTATNQSHDSSAQHP